MTQYARLAGLGQWLPERRVLNSSWPQEFVDTSKKKQGDRTLADIGLTETSQRCREIVAKYLAKEGEDPFLGSHERREAPLEFSAAEAEAEAGNAALHDAGVSPEVVDVVLSWAALPDRITPPSGCRAAELMGCRNAWVSGVDVACASPIVQLQMAAGLIESGRAKVVLLTQSHLMTRAFPKMHPASPGIGDAATAMVVVPSEKPGIAGISTVTHGQYHDAVLWKRGRTPGADTPWWQAGESFVVGSNNRAFARGLVRDTIPLGVEMVERALKECGKRVQDIGALASVQPRRWVPWALAEMLGLDRSIAPQSYDELAHLGGAGVIANLIRARAQGLLSEGTLSVLYAQGAGFTRGAACISW